MQFLAVIMVSSLIIEEFLVYYFIVLHILAEVMVA